MINSKRGKRICWKCQAQIFESVAGITVTTFSFFKKRCIQQIPILPAERDQKIKDLYIILGHNYFIKEIINSGKIKDIHSDRITPICLIGKPLFLKYY